MVVLCLIILVALAVIFSIVHLCCHIENPSIVDIKIKCNVCYYENIYYSRVLSCKNHFLVKIYVGLFIHIHFPRTELQ